MTERQRWFGPGRDGECLTDAELAHAIEADDLTADFVAAARAWAERAERAEADAARLRSMLSGVRNVGGCWCVKFPMGGKHEDRCIAARAALKENP